MILKCCRNLFFFSESSFYAVLLVGMFFPLLLLSLRLLKQAEKIQRAVFQWADGSWSSIQYILQWRCRMGAGNYRDEYLVLILSRSFGARFRAKLSGKMKCVVRFKLSIT